MIKKKQLAVAIATSLFVAGFADAQQQPQKVEKVEVTGSNIKRTDTETASPIQVISREDIERSGAATIGELLRNIPANNAGSLTEVGAVASFGGGASSISLRGLGGRATLVLINGRRVAPYGFGAFDSSVVDLNSIPREAVDRVEILKDGSSAIYGSDAIAGVVNVILRKDYKGAEITATAGITEQSDAKRYSARGTAGFGDIARDRYNAFVSLEHYEQDPLFLSERFSSDFRSVGYLNRRSTFAYPGNFYTVSPTGGTFLARNGECQGYLNPPVGQCLIDTNDYTMTIPDYKRDSVFARATAELSPNFSMFTELGYNEGKFRYQLDPQFYFNDEFGWGIPFAAGDSRNPTGVDAVLRYRAGDIGPRSFKINSKFSRALLGAKGTIGTWDWEAAGLYTKSQTVQNNFGNIITAEMDAALAAGFIPGNRAANGEAVYSRISPVLTNTGSSTAKGIDVKASTEFGKLAGGAIGLAVGAEYRKEQFEERPDLRYQNAEVFGSTANITLGERSVSAAFAEVNLPLLKTLEAQLAVRTDKYSNVSERSTTPKIGVKWVPMKEVALRGTFAKGFAAPTFQATTPTVNNYFTQVIDPKYCINGDEPECSWPVSGTSGGNPNLKPEKADSFTFGAVIEPTQNFSIALDYYSIQRDDEVSQLDSTYLIANPNLYPGFVVRDAADRIVSINTPYVNVAQTKTTGIDVDLKGKFSTPAGTLRMGLFANYAISWDTEAVPGSGLENYNGTWNQPRWRGNAFAEFERGPWVARLSHNHVGRFAYIGTPSETCARAQFTNGCVVAAYGTNDLFVGYNGFKNMKLSLVVTNLEDRGAPADLRSRDSQFRRYNNFFHSILGRMYYANISYKF